MFSKVCNQKFKINEKGKYAVSFDLSWQGGFKNELNCDGVYIFVKYKKKDVYGYESAVITQSSVGEFDYSDKTPKGFCVGTGSLKVGMYVPDGKLGTFIYPVEYCDEASIEIENTVIEVEMDGSVSDIQVFAIEMVYVPEGRHFVGDPENGISHGGKLKNCLYQYPDKGAYLIESEEEIKFAPEENCLYCDGDTANGRQEYDRFSIPREFPKGYKAMWYMKYSLTQEQFVGFLNCLKRNQQKTHVMSDISGDTIEKFYCLTNTDEELDRSAVYCRKTGNGTEAPVQFFTSAKMRACNAMSYRDVAAFACFSGLRLMTELEYEKACRGLLPAVASEFAWGSTNIGRVFHFDGVDGSGNEKPVSQKIGDIVNCNFGEGIAPFEKDTKTVPDNPGWVGPVSVGLFENGDLVPGYTKRECNGASYYNIMELSGNVWENLVSIGREEGRRYDGLHGNGMLNENGNHTMETWPNSETALGNGVRGGVFVSPNPGYVYMALRVFAAHTKSEKRYHGGLRVGF